MTVKQLREALAGYPDDSPVHVGQPSHDHWGAVLAPSLTDVDQADVEFSAYHDTDRIAAEQETDEDGNSDRDPGAGEPRYVVVLSNGLI